MPSTKWEGKGVPKHFLRLESKYLSANAKFRNLAQPLLGGNPVCMAYWIYLAKYIDRLFPKCDTCKYIIKYITFYLLLCNFVRCCDVLINPSPLWLHVMSWLLPPLPLKETWEFWTTHYWLLWRVYKCRNIKTMYFSLFIDIMKLKL